MPQAKYIDIKDLYLDLTNPRTVPQESEKKAIETMISIKPDRFNAVMESILDDGYLTTESVIVLNNGRYIVKEGNRRIAILKLIHGIYDKKNYAIPSNLQDRINSLTPEWLASNRNIPCGVYGVEEADLVDKIVNLTHAKGEKASRDPWTSVAKARHNRDIKDGSELGLDLLEKEGPKYQYGKGCLSDGVVGAWLSLVCGLDEAIDRKKILSHLLSVHKYNLKRNLRKHVNPQRSTFALGDEGGLLLCSWPKGGKLQLPFVYSNEVWTGIEYQVASHLMFEGEVEKGLDIVRTCRDRYDGRVRNPFNEYECGAWYARAMSSYAMLQALTGIQYDAVDSTLYIDSRIGDDFTSFLSTETGFGNVGLKDGKPFIEVKYGKIDVKKCFVSDIETDFVN